MRNPAYLMGSGLQVRHLGGGSGGVVTAVTDLAHFPVDGSRQVLFRKTKIYRSTFDDPQRARVVNDILERRRRMKLAEGDPWPELEPIAS